MYHGYSPAMKQYTARVDVSTNNVKGVLRSYMAAGVSLGWEGGRTCGEVCRRREISGYGEVRRWGVVCTNKIGNNLAVGNNARFARKLGG